MSMHEQARILACRIVCGDATDEDTAQVLDDELLLGEINRRLDAVGLEWRPATGVVLAAADLRSDHATGGLREAELAALASLVVSLELAPTPNEHGKRLRVVDFCETFGKPRGWKREYVRSAVLGPLERAGYIRVVTPSDRRTEQYITVGDRMKLIDNRKLLREIERAAT